MMTHQRHCELLRSNPSVSQPAPNMDCFAALAMTRMSQSQSCLVLTCHSGPPIITQSPWPRVNAPSPHPHQDIPIKSSNFPLSPNSIQIPRELYQNPQLLALRQICYNSILHAKAGATVIDLIKNFQKSPRKSVQNPPHSVGWPNPLFQCFLIQNT